MNDNEEVSKFSKNYVVLFIILLIFVLTLTLLVYFMRFRTDLSPDASSYNTTRSISLTNSYVFASPVRALAGGDLIRVTVFVLDSEGLGLFDRKVTLNSSSNLDIKEIQSLTDETGRSIFDLGSKNKSTYQIEVFVDGVPLNQNLKVIFD